MKLQDLLRYIADNVDNGKDWCDGLVSDKPWPMRDDVMTNYRKYELKPRTHVVNGFTVPAPESEAPEDGDQYYYASPAYENWHDDHTWENDKFDNRLLVRGGVFLTPEAAIANAKAMRSIDPKWEGEK